MNKEKCNLKRCLKILWSSITSFIKNYFLSFCKIQLYIIVMLIYFYVTGDSNDNKYYDIILIAIAVFMYFIQLKITNMINVYNIINSILYEHIRCCKNDKKYYLLKHSNIKSNINDIIIKETRCVELIGAETVFILLLQGIKSTYYDLGEYNIYMNKLNELKKEYIGIKLPHDVYDRKLEDIEYKYKIKHNNVIDSRGLSFSVVGIDDNNKDNRIVKIKMNSKLIWSLIKIF